MIKLGSETDGKHLMGNSNAGFALEEDDDLRRR